MLSLEDEDQFFALLIDHQGIELWRARGPLCQSRAVGLLEVLSRLK